MGYAFMVAACANCGEIFSFNPHKVPSLRINGVRHQICQACFRKWNEIHRVSKGLEPIPPKEGAYEACPEEEL
jgi:hypothetical protein